MPRNTNKFPAKLRHAHRMLHVWYEAHGRHDLPWRNTRDAYRIYLSEIMLQQTQVKTVLARFYAPFLNKFPTLASLARASREEVVKQWEGLGYYTRAGNLHAAAVQSGGALPPSAAALVQLPGVGRNTANAVACFAFGEPVPVMEANVRRVLSRIFALTTPDEKQLWEKAHLLLDTENPFDYNQAMMDIGAVVCTKRAPRCPECPWRVICTGRAAPESYPAPKLRKAPPVRRRSIVAFGLPGGRYYLQRRNGRFLTGLYGFMEYPAETRAAEFLGGLYPLENSRLAGGVTQVYSHFTLEAKVYCISLTGAHATLIPEEKGLKAATLDGMANLPLSGADHKVVRLLKAREAEEKTPSGLPKFLLT